MIFDIKIVNNSRRNARLIGGGHTTTAPSSIIFSSVVSINSVRISLTIASLNNLDILACDIQNAHLTALFREKIGIFAGPEFGEEEVTLVLVKMALYGLKSSGVSFQSKLAGLLRHIGYLSKKRGPRCGSDGQ